MQRRDERFPDNGFEAWGGYMQAKISKLEEQFLSNNENNKLSNIFNSVSIYVNGYTIPPADKLKELMSLHGGIYHTYQRSDDFIISSNLPDTKVKNMSLSRVVRPEWITDSIASEKLLDYRKYLLYGHSKTQPKINFKPLLKNEDVKTENVTSLRNFDTVTSSIKNVNTETKYSISLLDDDVITSPTKKHLQLKDVNSTKCTTSICKNEKNNDLPTKTAADPNFISEFYNNSRLHHISQLGAYFKQYINDLRENSVFLFPSRDELKQKVQSLNFMDEDVKIKFQRNKTIMHIDMDCFFVSVGLRTRPELRGQPVAVTHSKGGQTRPKRSGVDRQTEFNLYRRKQVKKLQAATGVREDDLDFQSKVDNVDNEDDQFGSMSEIASCSYEARAKGITNGMFMGAALKLCPELHTIPYDFEAYNEVAHTLYNTLAQYTLDIEAVSCDEMYVDCTEILNTTNINVKVFATVLRDEIKHSTGCPCSTGFGGNRLQARLATKKAKPDGQFFLAADFVDDFMFNIKLRDLPGVGRQTAYKLESLGHQTCGTLQSLPLVALQRHLGSKTGALLFDQCRGLDPNPLTFHTVRKSVSAEVNYGIRFENYNQCEEFLKQLSTEVQSRMQQFKVLGKCITLKLMVRAKDAPIETAKFMGHGFCDVINKSTTILTATNNAQIIAKEVISICKKLNIDPKEMRGIGIQITKLEPLNKQEVKGALNKFFVASSAIKVETSKDVRDKENNSLHKPIAIQPKSKGLNVSPKQKTLVSPFKKSPVISHMKSPTGRKRGRPSKTTKSIAPKNLMTKFLHEQPTKELTKTEIAPYENVNIKLKLNTSDKNQGLLGLSWEKVRMLLRAWFDSGQVPKSYDVDVVAIYLREMVVEKKIDKLNILVNFIRRRIREIDNSVWFEVEDHIMSQVQNAMIAIYGKQLWISKES